MRSLALGLLSAAGLLPAQSVPLVRVAPATPPAQSAIGDSGWIAVEEPGTCKVARRFDGADTSLTIALQGSQMLSGPDILLVEEGKLSSMKAFGSVGVAVLPHGATEKLIFGVGIDPASKRRHIEINGSVGVPLFLQIQGATTIQFSFDSRPPISIPAAGLDAALSVLRACQRREAAARGLDMAKVDAIAVPARPVDTTVPVFAAQSYPQIARRQNRMGDVEVIWTIDVTGNPRDCMVFKSSGTKSLDDASCLGIIKGARFHPAQDRAGRPVDMPQWTRVKWRLYGAGGLPLEDPKQ